MRLPHFWQNEIKVANWVLFSFLKKHVEIYNNNSWAVNNVRTFVLAPYKVAWVHVAIRLRNLQILAIVIFSSVNVSTDKIFP